MRFEYDSQELNEQSKIISILPQFQIVIIRTKKSAAMQTRTY